MAVLGQKMQKLEGQSLRTELIQNNMPHLRHNPVAAINCFMADHNCNG